MDVFTTPLFLLWLTQNLLPILLLIPFNYTGYVRNTTYRPLFKIFYWFLVADFLALFYIGQAPIEDEYILLGQYASVYYFSFFIFIVPIIGIIENKLAMHEDKPKEAVSK